MHDPPQSMSPVGHAQAPVALHVNVEFAQAMHTAPAGAHCVELRGLTHVPVADVQHPVEHEVESHTHAPVELHSWPLAALHVVMHATPLMPQFGATLGWQLPFTSQQPSGHECASHMQT